MSKIEEATEVVNRLNVKRLRQLKRRFDAPIEELFEDNLEMLLILSHEYWRVSTGALRDDWDRFEEMTLEELNDFLEISGEEDNSKSDDTDN